MLISFARTLTIDTQRPLNGIYSRLQARPSGAVIPSRPLTAILEAIQLLEYCSKWQAHLRTILVLECWVLARLRALGAGDRQGRTRPLFSLHMLSRYLDMACQAAL